MATAQSDLVQSARAGLPSAIESLLNRGLQKERVNAKVAMRKQCLQVMLEASAVPNEANLVPYVTKGIQTLNCKTIERIKIYGRQQGSDFPDWSREIELAGKSSENTSHLKRGSRKQFTTEHPQMALEELLNLKTRTSVGISYVDFPPVLGAAHHAIQKFKRSADGKVSPYCTELIEKVVAYYQMSLECLGLKVQRASVVGAFTFGIGSSLAGISQDEPLGLKIKEEFPNIQAFNAIELYDFDAVLSEIWKKAWELTDEFDQILSKKNLESLNRKKLQDAHEWMRPSKEEVGVSVNDVNPSSKSKDALSGILNRQNVSRKIAGVLAILLGSLGVHKFYLGYNIEGAILLISAFFGSTFPILSSIALLVGIIEGILYLRLTDSEFSKTYILNKRKWF